MTRNLQAILFALIIGAAAQSLASCSSSDHTPSGNSFVNNAIGQTSETAESTQINDLGLTFSESPTAFDSLFQ